MSADRARIGLVIGQLSHGGAERQLYELARALDPERFQSIVYCLSERMSPYGDLLRESGVPVGVIRRRGHWDLARAVELARRLREDRIDVVHAFLFQANGYAWLARVLARAPRLVTSARNCKGIGFVRDRVNRLAFRASDAIVCNGEAVRAFVVRHYAAAARKAVVVYNGVDLSRFAPAAGARATRRPGEPVVITVGRLVPQKDLGLFLEAASRLERTHAGARFLVVGDGPCRPELERAASRNGLGGRVSFLGERSDVPDLLRAADVFWLTSAWEGLPNVLLEAMACGKPVVARDVGACREVVRHGTSGYLVGRRDPDAFARYTLDLLADPPTARRLGEAGRRLAEENFSIAAMVRKTEELYRALLAPARAVPAPTASPSTEPSPWP